MKSAPSLILAALCLGAAGINAQEEPTEGVIEIHSPQEWSFPGGDPLTTRSRSLFLSGRVDHPNGIQSVVVNGLTFFSEILADGSWRFEGRVPITEDTDTVEVTGITRDGRRFEASYAVEPDLPSADAPEAERWNSALSGFRGERWAVVIGISDYAHPEIQDLRYADRDAQQFADFLISDRAGLGGFDRENVLLLLNEDATYRRLRGALYEFLKQPTEDDVVYVFWAGHGTPDPDRQSDLYLLPYDAEPDNIASTAIRMETLADALDRTLAKDKIVITDACHSAGVGMRGTRALGANPINDAFLSRLAMSTGGTVTVTSAGANELSSEGPQWGNGHGAFTHFLLEGLRGAADTDADAIVDVREMYEYAREHTRRATDNAQTPTISQTSFNPSWPMAAVLEASVVAGVESNPDAPVSTLRGAMSVDLTEGTWSIPDSMNAFVGVGDTIRVHLRGRSGPRVDGSMLSWGSGNLNVARVNDDGVVQPIAPGMTTISAQYYSGKRVELAMRVYDRPIEVEFTPTEDTIRVVRGEQVRLAASMRLPSNVIVRGVLPTFEVVDTLVLAMSRNDSDQLIEGQFRAVRDGTARVVGSLAGIRHEWFFEVEEPDLRITDVPRSLLAGSEIPAIAHHVREDGTPLTEAFGVSWESSDSTIVDVRLGGIIGRRPGKATLIASSGTTTDSVTVSVLGDLILSVEGDGRQRIETYSIEQDRRFALLDDEYGGWDAALSPDGSLIAFMSKRDGDPAPRIYVMDAQGSGIRRLVPEKKRGFMGFGRYYESGPSWSSDGRRVFFSSNRDGDYDLYSITSDGNPEELSRLSNDRTVERDVVASPDSPTLVFESVISRSDSDIIFALADGAEPINLTSERRVDGLRVGIRESRPHFIPNSGTLLFIEERPRSVGPALVRFDVASRRSTAQIVEPQSDHEIIYAVSPAGDRIAYHQRREGEHADARVVVADTDGNALQTFTLPPGLRLTSLSWGAVPPSSNR